MKLIVTAIGILAMSVACSKKKDEGEKPSEKPSTTKVAPKEKAAAATGHWVGFDKAAILAKLQGAWVVGGSSLGTKEAWFIENDKVTIAQGESEEVLRLELESPCSLKSIKEENGGTTTTTSKFTWQGDTLYKGLGNSGVYLENGSLVACVSGDIYTFDGTKCTKWKADMFDDTKFKSTPAECSVEEGSPKQFVVGSYKLEFGEGGALYNSQMKRNVAEKFPDHAAAKAKLAGGPDAAPGALPKGGTEAPSAPEAK